ncbi:transposase [Aeromonas enteropelogenes]|uniref:transposase n=1 Tax=Aeromonas enteropelogenes TaxID=29489 RepID=UPI003B9FA2AB
MRINQKLVSTTDDKSELLIVAICWDTGLLAVSNLLVNVPLRPFVVSIAETEASIRSGRLTLVDHDFPKILLTPDSQLESAWIKDRDKAIAALSPLIKDPELLHRYLFGDKSGILQRLIELSGLSKKYIASKLNRYFQYGGIENSLLPRYFMCGKANQLPIQPMIQNGTVCIRSKTGPKTRYGTPYRGVTQQDIKQIEQFSKTIRSGAGVKLSELYQDYCIKYESVVIRPPNAKDSDIAEQTRMVLPRANIISPRSFKAHLRKFVSGLTFLKKRVGDINYARDHAGKPGLACAGLRGPTSRYEIDSTIADVYIRYPYSKDELLSTGRPVIYFVIDTLSGMIVGLHVGFESPCWHGASQALFNAMSNKVAFCHQYGVYIKDEDWPCELPCRELTFDRGSENTDSNISSLLRGLIGITVGNFNAYHRGDMKGTIEKSFDIIQSLAIPFEAGKVVKNPQKEDQHASRRPFLTYEQFMARLIKIIIYSNNHRQRVSSHNFEMSRDGVGFTPRDVWNWGLENSVMVNPVAVDRLRFALLPEAEATVRAEGVLFKGLYYSSNEIVKKQWLDQAKNFGRYKIRVRYIDTCTNQIWCKTEDSDEVYQLELTDRSEAYRNQIWANVMLRLELVKHQLAAQDETKFNARVELEMDLRECDDLIRQDNRRLKKSIAKGMQPGMKTKKRIVGELQHYQEMIGIVNDLSAAKNPKKPHIKDRLATTQNLSDPTTFSFKE